MSSAPPGDAHPQEHWIKHRLRQFWLVIPLVVILAALMASDLGDFIGYSQLLGSNPCALTDADQSSISAKLYMPIAKWALRYTPSPSVAIIYIDPSHDPPDLLTNVCASRAFLARLIPDLNALSAHVIVLDKFYSAAACTEQKKNAAFISAVESSKVPIVVGEADHAMAGSTSASGCLALTPHLQFNPVAKVHYGLIRLDNDVLQIPLRWPEFTDPTDTGATSAPTQLPADSGDTLSLAAAKIVSPNIESNRTVQKLLAKFSDPYTTFLNLPNITALTALCSAESSPRAPIEGQDGDQVCKPWIRPTDNLNGKNLDLTGKIVVIGDISDSDMKPFPTNLAPFPAGQRPGVFLQANYIQSLLDHRFLLEIPMAITLGVLVLYVFLVYCLYWAHDEHGMPRLTADQAGFWSLIALAGVALLSFLALVTTSYFTPLWALWGAGVFMVFRYIEAKGHHRSQHLLGHLAAHHHPATHPAAAANPPQDDSNQPGNRIDSSNDGGTMNRIAHRIANAAQLGTLAILAACATLAAAQPPAPPANSTAAKPAHYSGCVQKDPNSTDLVVSTPTACARLTGDAASASKLAGHQVDLTGLFTPRTSSSAASIHVNSVDKVGAACSEVCSLKPPSSRGLQRPSNQAIPGSEGGTPGAVAEPK